jgi:Zn-dependent peptidase ImmA (M78 family)
VTLSDVKYFLALFSKSTYGGEQARVRFVTTYNPPTPTNASKAAISDFAEKTAKDLSFSPGEPIELVVAELEGAIAFSDPLTEERLESIRVEPDGRFKIFLPTMTSSARDRFTIAHELGHFFLHFPLVQEADATAGMRATRWVEESKQDLVRCEWEANWFAAAFLMPAELFRNSYAHGVERAAAFFAVSRRAVEVRASTLGLN